MPNQFDKEKEILAKTPTELAREWRDEERKKLKQKRIDQAREAQSAYEGPETAEEADAKSDWDHLIRAAKIKFPQHLAERFLLKPTQRLVAVAPSSGMLTLTLTSFSVLSPRFLTLTVARIALPAWTVSSGLMLRSFITTS